MCNIILPDLHNRRRYFARLHARTCFSTLFTYWFIGFSRFQSQIMSNVLSFRIVLCFSICSKRYFGLARNLIRRIVSPNQDDLSNSFRTSFSGQQKLGKLPNIASLAEQRRPVQTSHWPFFNSSNSMDT